MNPNLSCPQELPLDNDTLEEHIEALWQAGVQVLEASKTHNRRRLEIVRNGLERLGALHAALRDVDPELHRCVAQWIASLEQEADRLERWLAAFPTKSIEDKEEQDWDTWWKKQKRETDAGGASSEATSAHAGVSTEKGASDVEERNEPAEPPALKPSDEAQPTAEPLTPHLHAPTGEADRTDDDTPAPLPEVAIEQLAHNVDTLCRQIAELRENEQLARASIAHTAGRLRLLLMETNDRVEIGPDSILNRTQTLLDRLRDLAQRVLPAESTPPQALAPKYTCNWKTYVETWAERLEDARECPSSPRTETEEAPRGLQKEVASLEQQRDALAGAIGAMEPERAEIELSLLAGRCRLLQDAFTLLCDETHPLGKRMHGLFGSMTRLADRYVVPTGGFVFALRRGKETDWQAYVNACKQDLVDLEEREQERAVVREEIFDLLSFHGVATDNESPEPDADWVESLGETIRKFLDLGGTYDGQLLDELEPYLEHLEGPYFRGLRRAIRRRFSDDGKTRAQPRSKKKTETQDRDEVEDHPYAHLRGALEGQRVIMVGGTPRPERLQAIERFFGPEELTWEGNDRTERAPIDRLRARIMHGRYDLVIYLARFCAHAVQDALVDACKRAAVPFVRVERGYGLNQICHALEQTHALERLQKQQPACTH